MEEKVFENLIDTFDLLSYSCLSLKVIFVVLSLKMIENYEDSYENQCNRFAENDWSYHNIL